MGVCLSSFGWRDELIEQLNYHRLDRFHFELISVYRRKLLVQRRQGDIIFKLFLYQQTENYFLSHFLENFRILCKMPKWKAFYRACGILNFSLCKSILMLRCNSVLSRSLWQPSRRSVKSRIPALMQLSVCKYPLRTDWVEEYCRFLFRYFPVFSKRRTAVCTMKQERK